MFVNSHNKCSQVKETGYRFPPLTNKGGESALTRERLLFYTPFFTPRGWNGWNLSGESLSVWYPVNMARGKASEAATKGDLKKLSASVDKRFDKVDKRFDGIDKKIETLQHDVLDLKLDAREVREERGEIMKELKMMHRAIVRLDERVRYQQDIPERVEQLERDVHELKLKAFR